MIRQGFRPVAKPQTQGTFDETKLANSLIYHSEDVDIDQADLSPRHRKIDGGTSGKKAKEIPNNTSLKRFVWYRHIEFKLTKLR